jgi:prevent-host-death family protein
MEVTMMTRTVSEARASLSRLLDEVADSHKPAIIIGKRSKGILISEEDWNSIQETLHLLSIPGMRESIGKEMETLFKNCSEELDW